MPKVDCTGVLSGASWARAWLDLAHHADSQGYEKDVLRTIRPCRDWVVRSLKENMPFDRFTILQLAGDLLPVSTEAQLVATGFHRNTMTNSEGGTDDEEFRDAAVKDCVATTGQVWTGRILACAQCHPHKYDPISHKEFHQFYAFFAQTADTDRFDDASKLKLANGSSTLALRELPPGKRRDTHVHERGSFLSPGVEVEPAVPVAFHSFPRDFPKNEVFLFGGEQASEIRTAPPANTAFVPTPAVLQGDFNQLASGDCRTTPTSLLNRDNVQPLANQNLPASRLNLQALNLLDYISVSKDPCERRLLSIPNVVDENQIIRRSDWIARDKHTVSGRHFISDLNNPARLDGQNLLTTFQPGVLPRVKSVEFRLGNPEVVHHSSVYPRESCSSHARDYPMGEFFVCKGDGRGAPQQPKQGVKPVRVQNGKPILIHPGESDFHLKSQVGLQREWSIVSQQPHRHYRSRSLHYSVIYPNRDSEVLLKVPSLDFDWQLSYTCRSLELHPRDLS